MIGCEARARVSYKSNSTEVLEIGTKVQHKSGGPVMVVIQSNEINIMTRWVDASGETNSGWFYVAEFEPR
jgi:uncharacterized protein YodC (DUF2158 family)